MQEDKALTFYELLTSYAPYSYVLIVLSVIVVAMILRFIVASATGESQSDSEEQDSDPS